MKSIASAVMKSIASAVIKSIASAVIKNRFKQAVNAPLLLLLPLYFSACSQPISIEEDYLRRLENVLERKAVAQSQSAGLGFPSRDELEIEVPKSELSIREFLSMRDCQLHTVIAQRNSQLGKVASNSQRLFNDLQILDLGPRCIPTLKDHKLKAKLSDFLKHKEQNLKPVLWHALLASPEHASFWHDKKLSIDYPDHLGLNLNKELTELAKFVDKVLKGKRDFTQKQTDAIEQHLGKLRLGDAGHLLTQFTELQKSLSQSNSVIRQRLVSPLCLSGNKNTRAKHFSNIVNQFFIAKVQTQAVRLEQRAATLLALFEKFEKPLRPYATRAYEQWALERDQQFQQGRAAALKHVQLIQQLYSQCGLKPGR